MHQASIKELLSEKSMLEPLIMPATTYTPRTLLWHWEGEFIPYEEWHAKAKARGVTDAQIAEMLLIYG